MALSEDGKQVSATEDQLLDRPAAVDWGSFLLAFCFLLDSEYAIPIIGPLEYYVSYWN